MAVVFAMVASYLLSRTLVPTMARYLLAADAHRMLAAHHAAESGAAPPPAPRDPIHRLSARFEVLFERFRAAYGGLLAWALGHRRVAVGVAGGFVALSLVLVPFVGEDFFPTTDAGSFQLHLRAPAGTRVEQTELIVADVERAIRRVIPPDELSLILSNVGINRNGPRVPAQTPTIALEIAELSPPALRWSLAMSFPLRTPQRWPRARQRESIRTRRACARV